MEKHFTPKKTATLELGVPLERSFKSLNLSSVNKIHVQHHYRELGGGVERHYSCHQIFDGTSFTKQVNIRKVVTFDKINHESPEVKIPYSTSWFNWRENSTKIAEEPEDIDCDFNKLKVTESYPADDFSLNKKKENNDILKLNSIFKRYQDHTEDINEDLKEEKPAAKKETIHPTPDKFQDKPKMYSSLFFKLTFISLSIVLLVIAILFQEDTTANENTCDYSYFSNATNQFRELIYGQDEAMSNLQEYLVRDSSCVRVVALVGGSGVGKSYTVDIITKNTPPELYISKFVFPLYGDSNPIPVFESPHLVILENLMERDIEDVINLIESMTNVEQGNITFIIVFNFQEVNDDLTRITNLKRDMNKIDKSFQNANFNSIVIGYEPLTEESLEKCIIHAANENQVSLRPSQIRLIRNYLLINNCGCKGVDAKVQLFIEH